MPVAEDVEVITPLGNKFFEVKNGPLELEGKIIGFQTILRDATERKQNGE